MRAEAVAAAAAEWLDPLFADRVTATQATLEAPNSFTREAIDEAIDLVMAKVHLQSLDEWIGSPLKGSPRRVAVLNAGNLPFVGLQDLLAVVLSGHRYLGVVSRRSPHLLPAFGSSICRHAPQVEIDFADFQTSSRLADALIATGSTATVQIISRRFLTAGIALERQLLRGTRQGAALLDGSESATDLYELARDALLHEGRGCRNVAVVLAPSDLDPARFAEQADRFRRAFPVHSSTQKALARATKLLRAVEEPFLGGEGFVIVESDIALREPCVIRWIRYGDESSAADWLERNEKQLQVVVGHADQSEWMPDAVDHCEFGKSQDPPLDWRPDGVDTISFLRTIALTGL